MKARLRRWLPLAAFAAATLAGLGALARPEPRYIEYPCHYDLIYNQSGRVDLAFLGTSRTMRAIGAEDAARAIEPALGRPPVVFDLSRGGRGLDQMYTVARDLLERHEVGVLVVEFNKAMPDAEAEWHTPTHWSFPRQATYGDLLLSLRATPSESWWARAQTGLRHLFGKWNYLAEQWLTGRETPPKPQPVRPAATGDCTPYPKDVVAPTIRHHAAASPQWADPPLRSWELEETKDERYTFYADAIVDLARRHGTRIVFLYLQQMFEKPLDPAFVQRFEQRFRAPLLHIPGDALRQLAPSGYADMSHVNTGGRRLVMGEVMPRLLPFLTTGNR